MNDEAVSRAVFERNRKDEIDKRQVSEFNHYWAELIKANGFISMVAMFISCYLATANEKMHFLSVIAVLIINSRLSGTLISFVHRVYQILLYRHHIIESYSSLMKDSVRRVNGLDGMLKTSFEMLNLTVKIGNKEIVNNCSIKLVPGDFLGIRGNSGSGKTTLIKTLSAQIEPVGGGVYIDKNNITNLSESFFKNKFAYHTSSSEFISGSLYDNFNFYGIYSYEVMSKFLCLIRNDFEINHEILNVIPASSLPISNGERQRLLILMTLYKRPAVFFMDESTSFLSANDAVDFVNLIRFLYPKTIFVCATHEDKLTELFTHSIDLNVKA
ncbi:ATP-binding cassette domain-containing protein [Buttiauxella warmboldiae]|uniref:ATP-binding cassette domain-containing protein n=1 Tax=Buttiauxella warmboldiae TaxID=82993 RepID=A0A3N5EEQ5_9ENTR|nr:ATP-binding cassette domain-containing protein [Buttiauxella warmboldiae]RPH29652.1 ATP-binding cassette domain-containing protein [Buttiauxella warmboldiae]